MKKVIRCKKCEERVLFDSIGFVRQKQLICSKFHLDVDPDDGCTMGSEGEPTRKYCYKNFDVYLAGHEATG